MLLLWTFICFAESTETADYGDALRLESEEFVRPNESTMIANLNGTLHDSQRDTTEELDAIIGSQCLPQPSEDFEKSGELVEGRGR
jgi:hypothetical protein